MVLLTQMLLKDVLKLLTLLKQMFLLCIGKKGGDILSKRYNVIETNNQIFDDLTFENIAIIADSLMGGFLTKNLIV